MDQASMKDLLDRIIEAKYQENTFFYDEPTRPRPGGPASGQELHQLEAHFARKGLQVPQSYRQFLSIYNGIERVFSLSMSLSSITDVTREDYGLIEEMVEEFPSCSHFVIGAGNTVDIVAFDVASITAPDYGVVWITADARDERFKNFEHFLESYVAVLERNVLAQQKDRENLPP